MKPKQFFYGLGAIAAIVLIVACYMYWTSVSGLSTKSKQLGRLLADVKLAQEKSDQLKVLGTDYDKRVKPKLPVLDVLLPRDKDQAKIADQINSIASSTGVTVSGLTFSTAAATANPVSVPAQSVPVNFTAAGTYSQFQAFLQGIENFPRLSDIATLSLTKGTSSNDVNATFTLNSYYKP